MNTRQTSIEAFRQIKESGLLSERRLQVYEALFRHGPCTSGELFARALVGKTNLSVMTQSRARFTELRDLGVIREVGVKKCTATGRNAIVWDVTGGLPRKVAKKESKSAKLCQENAALRERVESLEKQLEEARRGAGAKSQMEFFEPVQARV